MTQAAIAELTELLQEARVHYVLDWSIDIGGNSQNAGTVVEVLEHVLERLGAEIPELTEEKVREILEAADCSEDLEEDVAYVMETVSQW